MKKTIAIILFISLAFSASLIADDKPLIFINTNSYADTIITANTGMGTFVSYAKAAGFRVDHGYHSLISDGNLAGIDVYFLPVPRSFILDDEKRALRRFVRSGKVLVIMGWGIGGNEDTFLQEFGMQFMEFKIYGDYGYVEKISSLAGPNKIDRTYHIGYKRISIINKAKAKALGHAGNGAIHSAEAIGKTIGKGKILVFNSLGMFIDESHSGVINREDNSNFVKNFLEYAKGNKDLAVTFAKPKGRNLFPGDSLTLIAKVKNLGDRQSAATKLTFYLTDDGSLEDDPSPASIIKKLKTISVPAIEAGKIKKLTIQGKIPTFVGPGTYYLVAQVDPAGTSGDVNISNNIKIAKKKVVVN